MITACPIFLFQWYGRNLSCERDVTQSWCKEYYFPYGYVQREYWDVGFMRYYQIKKVPLFLLAAPTLLMCFWAVSWYTRSDVTNYLTLHLFQKHRHPEEIHVFVYHLFGMTFVALLFMNVRGHQIFVVMSIVVLVHIQKTMRGRKTQQNYMELLLVLQFVGNPAFFQLLSVDLRRLVRFVVRITLALVPQATIKPFWVSIGYTKSYHLKPTRVLGSLERCVLTQEGVFQYINQ
eukprot:TRINITY_DN37397_c0_g1_i3.p1 TRINITY_DN37397_c0_g1~~TRINITY_DN37397_c0_g1_i3.p1  ORF type:complete len:233 (-),score=-9.07 TRINITY_DN37397_c0_g1_i3:343-1041(-)